MTLKAKFIASIALSIIIPSLIISIFSYVSVRKNMMDKEGNRLQNIAGETLDKIETLLEARQREIDLFSSMGVITSSFEYDIFDQADELLSEFVTNLPMYHQMHLLNAQNEVVATSDPASKGKTLQAGTGADTGTTAGKPYYDAENSRYLINITKPVFMNSKHVGTLLFEYDMEDIFTALDAIKVVKEGQTEGGHVMVFDPNSLVIYAPPFERNAQNNVLKENLKDSGITAITSAISGQKSFHTEKGEHGKTVVIGYDFNKGKLLSFGAIAQHETSSVLAEINHLFQGIAILVLILILLGVAAAAYVGTVSAKPIKSAVNGLSAGAGKVFHSAAQVSASSQSLTDSSSAQAASIEQTSASMEEMSSMTRKNAENANQANSLMKQAIDVIRTADLSMNEMSSSMEDISRASEETSKIVKTIDEIAFQTNLLALNAAVEAARAGEAGAGFAVVADEVRNLAMRAAEAAKNTSELIEGTVQKVNKGKEIVVKANKAFSEVAESSAKVDSLLGEITTASQEQAQGFTQINKAVIQMDTITQQNSAMAEESAVAAEELNSQAEEMTKMIDNLKLVVDGGSANLTGREQSIPQGGVKSGQPQRPSPRTISRTVRPQQNKQSAQQLIPMDEDEKEFEDF